MNKELNLEEVRKEMIIEYCKNSGSDFEGEMKHREMVVHKNRSMTTYGSLGYLFFALKGSPPKAYAVFVLGNPSNEKEAKGRLIINGNKKSENITITGLEEIEDNAIIIQDCIKEI